MSNTWLDGGSFVHTPSGGTLFQAFTPDVDSQVSVTGGVGSARVALPTNSRVFRIHADNPCFLNFGGSSVTSAATDMPFDAGTEIMGVPEPHTYIAAIRNGSTDSVVTITPMG